MMCHAGERQKNLRHHPFTWNKNKQYTFKPAESAGKYVSSYLGFSVHLVLLLVSSHTCSSKCCAGCQWAVRVGECHL